MIHIPISNEQAARIQKPATVAPLAGLRHEPDLLEAVTAIRAEHLPEGESSKRDRLTRAGPVVPKTE